MGKMDKIQMMIDLNSQLQQSCSKQDYPKQKFPKHCQPPSKNPKECWTPETIITSAINVPSAPPSESWPTQNLLFRPFWSIQDNMKEFWDPDKGKEDSDPPNEEIPEKQLKKKKRKGGIIACAVISLLITILVLVVLIYTMYKKQTADVTSSSVPLITTTWAPKIANPFTEKTSESTLNTMTDTDLETLKINYAMLDNEKRNLQRDIATYLNEIKEYEILYSQCKQNTSTKANISESIKDVVTPMCIPVHSEDITQTGTQSSNNDAGISTTDPSPITPNTQSPDDLGKRFTTTTPTPLTTGSNSVRAETSNTNSEKLSTKVPENGNGQNDNGDPEFYDSTTIHTPIPLKKSTTKPFNPKNTDQIGGATSQSSVNNENTTTLPVPVEFNGQKMNNETTQPNSSTPQNTNPEEETTKSVPKDENSLESTTLSAENVTAHSKTEENTTPKPVTPKSTNPDAQTNNNDLNTENTWKTTTTSPSEVFDNTSPPAHPDSDNAFTTTTIPNISGKTTFGPTNSFTDSFMQATTTPGNRKGRKDNIHDDNYLSTSTPHQIPTKQTYTAKSSTQKNTGESNTGESFETTTRKKGMESGNSWETSTKSGLDANTFPSVKELTTSKPSTPKNEEFVTDTSEKATKARTDIDNTNNKETTKSSTPSSIVTTDKAATEGTNAERITTSPGKGIEKTNSDEDITTKSPNVQTERTIDEATTKTSSHNGNKIERATSSPFDNFEGKNTNDKIPNNEEPNSDGENNHEGLNEMNDQNQSQSNRPINGKSDQDVSTQVPTSTTRLHWFTTTSTPTATSNSNGIGKNVNGDEYSSSTTQTPEGNNLTNGSDSKSQDKVQKDVWGHGVVAHNRPDNLPNTKNDTSKTPIETNPIDEASGSIEKKDGNNSDKDKMPGNDTFDNTTTNIPNVSLNNDSLTKNGSKMPVNTTVGNSRNESQSNNRNNTNRKENDDSDEGNSSSAASPFTVPETQDLHKNGENDNSTNASETDQQKKKPENHNGGKNMVTANNSSKSFDSLNNPNTRDDVSKPNEKDNVGKNSAKIESGNDGSETTPKSGKPNGGTEDSKVNYGSKGNTANNTIADVNQSKPENSGENKQNSEAAVTEQATSNNETSNTTSGNNQNNETNTGENSIQIHQTKTNAEKSSKFPQKDKPKKGKNKRKSKNSKKPNSEEDSEESKEDGKDSEKDSKDSEKDSKDSEKDSKDSEKDSKDSEKDSKDSEKDSKESEKDSKESENDDKDSENDSKESEEDEENDEKISDKSNGKKKGNKNPKRNKKNNENDNKSSKKSNKSDSNGFKKGNENSEISDKEKNGDKNYIQKPNDKKTDKENKASSTISQSSLDVPVSIPETKTPKSKNDSSMVCSKSGKTIEFPFSRDNNSCYLNYTQCGPKKQEVSEFVYNTTCLLMLLDTGKNPANGIMPEGTNQYILSIAGDHDGSFAVLITMGENILLKVKIEEVGHGGDLARVLLSSSIKFKGQKYFTEEVHPVRFKSRGWFTMIIISGERGYTIICNNQWKLPLTFKQKLIEDSKVRRIKFDGSVTSSVVTFEVLNT